MRTRVRARAGDTPHFHATQWEAERMPHPCQDSVSSTRAIRLTSRPVAAFITPHT